MHLKCAVAVLLVALPIVVNADESRQVGGSLYEQENGRWYQLHADGVRWQVRPGVLPCDSIPPFRRPGPALRYETDVPSMRPVAMGEDQKVRADITATVKGWLAKPVEQLRSCGWGPRGARCGTVELKSDALEFGNRAPDNVLLPEPLRRARVEQVNGPRSG